MEYFLLAAMRFVSARTPAKLMARVIVLGTLICAGARAEDNTTTTFSGVVTNLGGLFLIGDTGTNNALQVLSGAKVFNTTGTVGNASSANFNSILVGGVGSIYTSQVFWVGNTGSFNQVTITNGGKIVSGLGTFQTIIGRMSSSSNNSVVVTGTNSLWSISGDLRLGPGFGNKLTISGGAQVNNTTASILGDLNSAAGDTVSPVGSNTVVVTGSNSVWNAGSSSAQVFWVGRRNSGNQVIITNGGTVNSYTSVIGVEGTGLANNNRVTVTGTNSLWKIGTTLTINFLANEVLINNGGTVVATNILVGGGTTLNNDTISISGGNLLVTNATSTATYEVRKGSNILNSGSMTVDNLIFTNGANSLFKFSGGTLNTKNSSVSNTFLFVVGDGASSATLNLQGGTHQFFNGLRINTNATLKGTGTIQGDTTVVGTLAPGASPGVINFGNLTLASNSTFAVELNGTTVGSGYDQANVTGTVNISNSILNLSLGFDPTPLVDSFTIIQNDSNDIVAGFLRIGTNVLTEGTFLDVLNSNSGRTFEFQISYVGGTGNDVVLLTTAVPEPSVLWLSCLGAMSMLFLRRRARV